MRAHEALFAVACAAAVVGCAPGKSALTLSVDATGQLSSVDHLQVSLTDPANRHAGPYAIAVPGGTIPPTVEFALAFGKDVKGTIVVAVDAVDASGTTLASAQGQVAVEPSESATLALTLAGGSLPPGDGGDVGDMAVIPGYHLVFSTQPANGAVDTSLAPSVTVTLTDGNGATIPASDAVTLTTATNGAGARLNGATTVAAVNGVAIFDNVAVDRAATGLTLVATASTYASTNSSAFDVAGAAWQPVFGISGGSASQIVFDHANSKNVVAVSPSGKLFESSDGGQSWFPIGYGIPASTAVFTVALDPMRSGIIYAATSSGVFKSSNGGNLFTQLANAPASAIDWITLDPQTPDVVFVVTAGNLYKSTDAGAHFAQANNGIPAGSAGALLIDPRAHLNMISIALQQYWSNDGGATWTQATTGVPANSSGVARGLAIDPTTSGVAYDGNFKTTDGGKNWAQLTNSPPVSGTIVPDPTHAGTIYYAGQSRFGGQLVRTTDNGMTYTSLAMLPIPSNVQPALDVDPANPQRLLFSDVQIDIERSTDAGATWTSSTQGYSCTNLPSVSIDPLTPTTVYVATPAEGVLQTTNSGKSWVSYNVGLSTKAIDVVAADPGVMGRVYAAVDLGNDTTTSRIWYATGGVWQLDSGSPMRQIDTIVYDSKSSDQLYAIDITQSLYSNANNTQTWSQVTMPASCPGVTAVATNPTTAQDVYVDCGVLLYHGNARTAFTQLSTSLSNSAVSIVFDPATPATLYALTTDGTAISVEKTTNSFGSVTSASTGLSGGDATLLAIDPIKPATLWLVGNHLYKTTDSAATWAPAEAGLPSILTVHALAIDPVSEGTVYAATSCGLYKTTTGGK